MLKDDPEHWTRLTPLPKPARPRKSKAKALDPPPEPPPPPPPPPPYDPPPARIGPRALSLAEARKRDQLSAVIGSVLFHILLLWGVGRMVPEFNPRLFPDTPSVQLTLVDPIIPEETEPLVLRRLETPPEIAPPVTVPIPEPVEAPPVAVPIPQLQKAQRIEVPKNNARPTTPRALPKLMTPTAPPAPVAAPTPAPPTPLPQIIKAPPSTLEDLDLHKTPAPTQQLRPKLTLPAPPSFGEPGGGPPGSAAPGGGAPGVAAPGTGTGAKPNYDFTYSSGSGMNCSKAAMAVMSAADQEKCRVMAALQAAAALKNMKAADRNSAPLDRLGPELRTGFNAERDARTAKAHRGAAALGEIGARNVGATSSAAAGVRCGLKIGPLADKEKLSCGVGFNPAK